MTFQLEVSVTEKCNLGCPYCYVANQDNFMTEEAFDDSWEEFKTLVKRSRAVNSEYYVSYFGGEPLLNMDIISYSAEKYYNRDPKCSGMSVISNLTLIDEEKLNELERLGVGLAWSFDGTSANESRPLIKNMKENDGYENILEIYEQKKHLISRIFSKGFGGRSCKVMIFPGNVSGMSENFKFLVEFGVPEPGFAIVRDDIWSEDDIRLFRKECRRLADTNIEYLDSGKIVMAGFFHLAIRDMLIGLTKEKRPFGCFAGHHGAVLTTEGKFFPCARWSSKKLLPMKGDTYNFNYYQKIFNPKTYDKCKDCRLYKVCNSGCTYSQVRNNNAPVDSVCELFHIYHDETLCMAEICKDMPAYQKYIKMLFSGRTEKWYTPDNDHIPILELIEAAKEPGIPSIFNDNAALAALTPSVSLLPFGKAAEDNLSFSAGKGHIEPKGLGGQHPY
jgi:radical SAM protein with 4Fe4S-binding SPASM domain